MSLNPMVPGVFSAQAPYAMIAQALADASEPLDAMCLGLTWTYCKSQRGLGFAMSPGLPSRTLAWPGTVRGRATGDVAGWLSSWDPFEACVGLAAANAAINGPCNPVLQQAEPLACATPSANLSVFEYFRPRLEGKKVVIIGRYPGLDTLTTGMQVSVLERVPGVSDLPDPAAEFMLPEADWVFITASSLANKTFPRLAQLSQQAVTVLMGPSLPWLSGWADFGIDYLAGVQVVNPEAAMQIAAEGGGMRLFGDGVRYALADIGLVRMQALKQEIASCYERRLQLKNQMTQWYEAGNTSRFPDYSALLAIDETLSRLDLCYKRQWDARCA